MLTNKLLLILLVISGAMSVNAAPVKRIRFVRTVEDQVFLALPHNSELDLSRARSLVRAAVYGFQRDIFTSEVRTSIGNVIHALSLQNLPDQVIVYVIRAALAHRVLPIEPRHLAFLLSSLPSVIERLGTDPRTYSVINEIFSLRGLIAESFELAPSEYRMPFHTYASTLVSMAQNHRSGLMSDDRIPALESADGWVVDGYPVFSARALEVSRAVFDVAFRRRQFGEAVIRFNERIGSMSMSGEQHVAHLRLFWTVFVPTINNMNTQYDAVQSSANVEVAITEAVFYAMRRPRSLQMLEQLPAASLEYVSVWLNWTDRRPEWERLRELNAQRSFLEHLAPPPSRLTSSSHLPAARSY